MFDLERSAGRRGPSSIFRLKTRPGSLDAIVPDRLALEREVGHLRHARWAGWSVDILGTGHRNRSGDRPVRVGK
jgi:hypothetical protein